MKFNFKKIASVLAATIMLGSTIGFAAAAWPAPFVSSGSSASAVVYGANAPTTGGDMAAAINLGAELDKSITVTTTTGTTTGDTVKLAKSTNLFNIGEDANDFYSTLDEEQLSKVLATGVYTNDANNEYDYEQSIVMGDLQLSHFLDSDFNDNKPVIGFDLADGRNILNYTLEFTPTAAENTIAFGSSTTVSDDLETSLLPMLGMTYYIQKVESTATGVKMTLLDNANDASVTEGEDKTVTVGDNSYSVKINFIDADETILEVNGVKTNKLTEGGVFKIGTDTYVAIKSILYNAKESGISSVEFSIGSGKITLDNGKEVLLNGEAISDTTDQILTAYITNASTSISKIKLQWSLDNDAWLAPGSDLILPGFETIKISMAGFNQPLAEKTTLKEDGDSKFTLWTTIKDGELKLPLLYNNATNIIGLGEKATHRLVTNNITGTTLVKTVQLNESLNDYFVATWISGKDFESYAYEINGITDETGKNATVLKNMAGGSDISFSEVGKDKDRGNINFKLEGANDKDKYANITLTVTTGALYLDRLVTKEGMQILLPLDANKETTSGVGSVHIVNVTAGNQSTSWTTNVSEEDKDGNIFAGKAFSVASTVSSDGLEPTTLAGNITNAYTYETEDGSNIYEGYAKTPLATKVTWSKPTSGANTLEITYAGEESYADVYIAEASATVGSVKDSVKVVTDAEVASVKDKNLIVVGGSCINTVAASMLGSTSPICGEAWATKTGAGLNKYLVQVAASPVNAEKIAMLVAGYESADTQNAVAKVKEGAVSTDVGTKLVGPVAA